MICAQYETKTVVIKSEVELRTNLWSSSKDNALRVGGCKFKIRNGQSFVNIKQLDDLTSNLYHKKIKGIIRKF